MSRIRHDFDLNRERDVERLNLMLFEDISENDIEVQNEFGDNSDTEGEDNIEDRHEDSETEQSADEENRLPPVTSPNVGSEAVVTPSVFHQFLQPQHLPDKNQPVLHPQNPPENQPIHQPQPLPQLLVNDDVQVNDNDNVFVEAKIGKDKMIKWYFRPRPQNQRTQPQNILRRLPGVIGPAKQSKTALECWSNFFTEAMLQNIVFCTNSYIENVQAKFSRMRDAKTTDIIELKAAIGLLYLLGVNHSNRQSLEEMWATDGSGIEKFRLTMNLRRFKFLIRCLRFDNLTTRPVRRNVDNLAAVRELFTAFVDNCKRSYSLGENVTVDEKLEAFRGRCRFRQYIPSKPAKYGVKIFALCDAKTYYTSNLEIYCGKQPEGPYRISNKAEDVVKRITEPIYGSGRNITADNWFTSVALVDFLKSKSLSYVGTMKKNRIGIPSELKQTEERPVSSSFFVFRDNSTMVSFVPKKNKNVILISSLHHDDVVNEENSKPEIILHYNKTKSGVDCVDKLCATYNVARNTRRWTMVVFFALLNIGGINALVVSFMNCLETSARRMFLRKLSDELVADHLQRRAETTVRGGISLDLQQSLKKFKPAPVEVTPTATTSNRLEKRKRCQLCKNEAKPRLTQYFCFHCKNPVCLEHTETFCKDCAPKMTGRVQEEDSTDE